MGVALEPQYVDTNYASNLFCLQTFKVHIPEEMHLKMHTGIPWATGVCHNRAKAIPLLFYPKIPTTKKVVAVICSRDGPSAITMVAFDFSVKNR